MAKTKILNSLINNLAHSYFSTYNHYGNGYLSDWIVNSANEIGVDHIEIDIINKKVFPKKLEIKPILDYLDPLLNIINKNLISNKLATDFIVEAKFIIDVKKDRVMVCNGYVRGSNGMIYSCKPYVEKSYEIFTVLNPKLIEIVGDKIVSFKSKLKFYLWRRFKIGELNYTKRLKK